MKHKIFLFVMLFMAFSQSLFSIELDTVWVSDESGQILFQHPVTKNILIAKNGITEIDSKTGKFVRNLSYDISNIEISPDGSKYLTSGNNTYIYNLETGEGLDVIEFGVYSKFLSNDIVICRDRITSNLIVYNLTTKEKRNIQLALSESWVTALATSPDGKYISYATYEKNNTLDSKVYLYLMDAETMKEIKQLGSWESEGHNIAQIKFSSDSKFITFSNSSLNTIPLSLFNIDNGFELKFNSNINNLFFINNKYYVINGRLTPNPNINCQIKELNTNKIIFENYDYILNTKGNDINNIFYCNNYIKNTYSFNLENIISGIPPTNPINIRYNNKTLFITLNGKTISNLTINTIEGREVFKQNFMQISFQNQIEIPLDLSNGLYFININSGSDIFVHKLLVKE